MAKDLKLAMVLEGKDKGAARLLKDTEAHLKKFGPALRGMARESAAYGTLGIRSQRQIIHEIRQTQAAYNRLARSGRLSGNELSRAAQAAKARIRELNAELGKSVGLQGRFGKAMRIGAGVAAGTAAAAVLKPAMNDQKQLDDNITQVAWQAFGEDKTKSAQWIASEGKAAIRSLALELVKNNGGNHDAALSLINSMMANGMSFDEVRSNSRTSYRAMLASGEGAGQYAPEETAKLMKVLSDYGFKGNDLARAFEYAMKSGMQGNFEIADMVRELPALLPAAKNSGMDNLEGFAFLLSSLQSAANKAGSNSEAANNVRNLLEKTLSADTVKRLSKLANPQQPGKGIDWEASVLRGREKGENAVQALSRLANAMLEKDAQYQGYKKRAESGDKTAESQMNIMRGFVLSSIMPDIQAKAGLLAASDIEQVKQYYDGLLGLKPDDSLVDKKLGVTQTTALAAQEKADSETMLQQTLTAPLIEAETALKQLSAEYPNATLALQSLTAAATTAAGAIGLMGLMNGKGAGGGIMSSIAGWKAGGFLTGGGAGGGAAAGGGLSGAAAPLALAAAPLALMGGAAYLAGRRENYGDYLKPIQKLNGWLDKLIPDMTASSRAEYLKKREELGGNNAPAQDDRLVPAITQQTTAYQTSIAQQTADYQASLQANGEMLGGKIGEVTAALASVNPTINNNIAVNLDGRVIANEVSRHQVNMFGRGAGQ